MSPKKRNQRLFGYTRVSRSREEGISPELQRKAISAYAEAHDHQVEWLDVDLDESGKNLDRPAMREALARLERREADGIIAARLDRFTRSVGDLGELLRLADGQNWNLVAIDLGVDLTTSNGKLVAHVLGSVAEWELDRRRESWRESRSQAVERGIHVTSTTPVGYRRDAKTRKLIPNEHAKAVRRAFEARAKGESWAKVAALLTEAKVPTSHRVRGTMKGPLLWQAKSAERVLRNRVYLGEARSGEFVQPGAHEAIISPGLFARVQARRQQPGSFAAPKRDAALLAGIARCANCGGPLTQDSTVSTSGKRYRFYRCKSQKGCPERPSIGAQKLEDYVVRHALEHGRIEAPASAEPSPEYDAALAAVEAAEDRLAEWESSWRSEDVSMGQAAKMTAELERERDKAVEALNALPVRSPDAIWTVARQVFGSLPSSEGLDIEAAISHAKKSFDRAQKEGISGETLAAIWHVNKDRRREILKSLVKSASVTPGRLPAEDRVTVQLRAR